MNMYHSDHVCLQLSVVNSHLRPPSDENPDSLSSNLVSQ